MKTIKFLLLFLTIIFSLNNNVFSTITSHPPEVFWDVCGWHVSQYNDFYPSAIVYGGYARYYSIGAYFGFVIEKNINNTWTEVANVDYITRESDMSGIWFGVDQLMYPSQYIAPHGNGEFRVSCFVRAESAGWPPAIATSPWSYVTITDVVSPSEPGSFTGSWVSEHPYISWSTVIQDDLEEYVIYKKVGSGSWLEYATTTASNYTDGHESQYTIGDGDKRFVYYCVTARDYTENESDVTAQVNFTCAPWLSKTNEELVALEDPINYYISANYPNPFNPTTQISYQLPENSFVNLVVYNAIGQKVAELVNQNQSVGKYTVKFDASNLPSGVYIYKLQAGEFSAVKKMLLTK
ncbi:MAG: T9SS type A sorting domain-containing protein [Bacteroidetes bacterium]|nr:T9SS type A sorting domain-containing protein [Bacteroidota bacterium]MBU1113938.1 T9SS type A sorting domain-containing protein [Bacteroidota bacterium]MBU1798267.1 T9SS type A sorting domain-containing protein [Bacteroidota bacterium]